MTKEDSRQHDSFDHSTAWQSRNVATEYDARRFRSWGGRFYDRMEKSTLKRALSFAEQMAPIRDFMEVACGTGRISEMLAQRGYRLTCADISEEMLAQAKERLPGGAQEATHFAIADIYNLDYPDGSFDCVGAFRLFQHLTSDERASALTEMARVSRRFILVNVMYTSAYYGFIRTIRKTLGRYTTRQVSSRGDIQRELSRARLNLVKSWFTQPGFNGNLVLLMEKT